MSLSFGVLHPLEEYDIVKWVRANTLERLSLAKPRQAASQPITVWKDRQDAEEKLKSYLFDFPCKTLFANMIDGACPDLFLSHCDVPPRSDGQWQEQSRSSRHRRYSQVRQRPLAVSILNPSSRRALIIDCEELMKANSDSMLVSSLAAQTGYWPIFTFMNSMNTLIDLASVGMIGQKGDSF